MIARRMIAAVLCVMAVMAAADAFAEPVNFSQVTKTIVAKGDAAIATYVPESGLDTADEVSSLYFDVFEGSGMEAAVAIQDGALKSELESAFGRVIGLASRGASRQQVGAAWADLTARLQKTGPLQSGVKSGFWSALIQSFLILVREGFEAILVVTALVTYLRRSGAGAKVRVIYQGVGWALAASFLTAYVMSSVIETSGSSREGFEGATMLIAAAVLFYVSYWLISKREAGRWQKYVRDQVDRALSGGTLFTLGFAAFLAVYREGAETVLFYQALSVSTQGQFPAVAIGFMAAALALAFLFWVMRTASLKVPMGVFFSATAVFLYFLAVTFAGTGVLELQEARWVSITELSGIPRVSWLGLFPTVESVSAQLVLLAPLPVAAFFALRKWRRCKNAEVNHGA